MAERARLDSYWVTATSFLAVCIMLYGTAHTISAQAGDPYSKWFNGDTIRLDLNHSGNLSEEHYSIARTRKEGSWPGSHLNLIDTLGFGDYMLSVSDTETKQIIYSRGFDSQFEPEATWTTAIDSVRFPYPRNPVVVTIGRRDKVSGHFVDAWHSVVDPADTSIDRRPLSERTVAHKIFVNGSPSLKVDLVILGDGYTGTEASKFWSDAKRASDYLFSASPFKEKRDAFNVRAVFVASETTGISSPLDKIWSQSALGASYNAHGVERDIEVQDVESLFEAAATVPYDAILVITNSKRYGGSGGFQLPAIAAIDSAWSRYLVVHEFGHTFAGLADEYYTLAECSASSRKEPWQPNITATDTREALKWRSYVAADVPIPTPWAKREYESLDSNFAKTYFELRKANVPEKTIDDLIRTTVPRATELLENNRYYGKVGAYEGAGNEACGLFRPELNCTMFTLNPNHFCLICSKAIQRVIEFYSH